MFQARKKSAAASQPIDPSHAALPLPPVIVPAKEASVLIIDDLRADRVLMTELLSKMGFPAEHICVCSSLSQGRSRYLELLKEDRPIVVVLDVEVHPDSEADSNQLARDLMSQSPSPVIVRVSSCEESVNAAIGHYRFSKWLFSEGKLEPFRTAMERHYAF